MDTAKLNTPIQLLSKGSEIPNQLKPTDLLQGISNQKQTCTMDSTDTETSKAPYRTDHLRLLKLHKKDLASETGKYRPYANRKTGRALINDNRAIVDIASLNANAAQVAKDVQATKELTLRPSTINLLNAPWYSRSVK